MAPKPYKTNQDDPTIEGKIKFNFKMKASGINSKTKNHLSKNQTFMTLSNSNRKIYGVKV